MLTLTVAEIKDLAECAGLVFNQKFMPDGDDLDTEIVVMECPKEGVRDDDNKPTHYAHIAYFAEYPEEGSYPLGPELKTPNAKVRGPEAALSPEAPSRLPGSTPGDNEERTGNA